MTTEALQARILKFNSDQVDSVANIYTAWSSLHQNGHIAELEDVDRIACGHYSSEDITAIHHQLSHQPSASELNLIQRFALADYFVAIGRC